MRARRSASILPRRSTAPARATRGPLRLLVTGAIALFTDGGAVAHAAPPASSPPASAPPASPPPRAAAPGAAPAFRTEPRAAFDDVFGDAASYRRTVDRFSAIADQMQQRRDDFARAVQGTLARLQPGPDGKKPHGCPEAAVAAPYARALHLGQDYLRSGRELTRHYDEVKELDHLGETAGLTPDYRARVKRVVAQYQALLVDYREMKVAFHDQLDDELHYASCDADRLLARAARDAVDDKPPAPSAATGSASGSATGNAAVNGTASVATHATAGSPRAATRLPPLRDEAWPAPGQPGAPGVALPSTLPAAGTLAGAAPESPPAPVAAPAAVREPPVEILPASRSGILFHVDNSRCRTGSHVTLDGRPLADVPAATRASFETTPGPHDLCLLPEGTSRRCGEPGTARRSYLHEGWTIALRCE